MVLLKATSKPASRMTLPIPLFEIMAMHFKNTTLILLSLLLFPLLFSTTVAAMEAPSLEQPVVTTALLTELSIEDLMQVKIYSVSKRSEQVMKAAAAIHVITREDIERSGVTSIPDALRMAPGIHVARIDANKWAISARGFSDRYANKLLVLQDGQTLYSPTFSGVNWNIQDIMLEDIERIEVIRGPGSALWGANAMNGVINIVTRSAKDTIGGLVSAGGGSFEEGFGALRYGVKASDKLFIRAYGKYYNRDNQTTSSGFDQEGHGESRSGGFRADWAPSQSDSLTIQGDLYDSRPGAGDYNGGNILGRWNRQLSDTSSTMLLLYYNYTEQEAVNSPETKYREKRDTVSFELQHNFQPTPSHNVVWGGGYRFNRDETGWFYPYVYINPEDTTEGLFNLFLQDDITLLPEKLHLILGLRAEHNDYTGAEFQPTARLNWAPNNQHNLWSAITRAVRTPSRVQDGIVAQPLGLTGSTSLQAETLMAYEVGYRHQPIKQFWLDLALFYNDYDKLIGVNSLSPRNIQAANNVQGESWGAELSTFWQPADFLDLKLTYSWLEMRMHSDGPQPANDQLAMIGTYPEQQVSLRSGFDLGSDVRLDLWLRYVGALEQDKTDDYTELEARISWVPLQNLELSLVGQNLLNSSHYEFSDDFFGAPATMTDRSMYGKVTWSF